MSGFAGVLACGGGSSFTPVTRTYSAGVVGATETAPTGASNVSITVWGAGGGGARDNLGSASGGASGAYVQKAQATSGGSTFTYTVGFSGAGHVTAQGSGSAGSASTVTTPALSAGGGGGGVLSGTAAVGGAAAGGTVNTAGNNSLATAPDGYGAPNGGGNQTTQGAVGTVPGGGGASNYGGDGGRGAMRWATALFSPRS